MEKTAPSKSKKLAYGLSLGLALVLLGGLAGYFIGYSLYHLSSDERKLVDEYRLLKEDWLYGSEDAYLEEQAMKGLLSGPATAANDPYTFYTGTEAEQGLSTSHTGFGYSARSYDGGLYITEVMNTANDNDKKIQTGDILRAATREGETSPFEFSSHTYAEIMSYLSSGTTYDFRVERNGAESTLTLTKTYYEQNVLTLTQVPNESNGYTIGLRVETFLGTPAEQMEKLLSAVPRFDTVVLDLRQNGGGYVAEAERMLQLFVRKGTLFDELVDKNGKVLSLAYQTSEPKFPGKRFRLLIDHGTASASELFTLGMRAGADTTVYGLLSYGKGIAQDFKTFSDKSVVRYTSAYVFGPERENETMYDEGKDGDSVMCIHGKGIQPDVVFPTDYDFLGLTADYTSSLGISEAGQNHFLKVLHLLRPEKNYPSSYSSSYLFNDAERQFGKELAEETGKEEFADPFETDGRLKKIVNDKFLKVSYDGFLSYQNQLSEEVYQQ